MIVTTDQFIDLFRSDVFDKADTDDAGNIRDVLWSDDDIISYLNRACARWAADTLALRRRFDIAFDAAQATAKFPYDLIIDDLAVSFVVPGLSVRRTLKKFDIDSNVGSCDDYGNDTITVAPDLDRQGMPTHYTRDYDDRMIRLYPVPNIAGTLSATATVFPQTLYIGMPLPCSAQADLDLIMMAVKKEAYAKQDADTYDLARSQAFDQEYRFNVTRRASLIDRQRRDVGILRSNV